MAHEMDTRRLSLSFARVVRVLSLFGIVILVVAGITYFFGWNGLHDVETVFSNVEKPAEEFWRALSGEAVSGYAWFIETLPATDSLSVLGIAFLAVTPFFALLSIVRHARKVHLVFVCLLMVEYLFIVCIPLFRHA